MTVTAAVAALTPEQREALIAAIAEFDPSDAYHSTDKPLNASAGFYAAIDRVTALLRGQITSWQSPRVE